MSDPTQQISDIPDSTIDYIRDNRSKFKWIGLAMIAVGALAILFPFVASVAAKVMVGWFLLIAGAFTLFHAFQARAWSEALLSGLIGVLHIAAGVYLAFFPLTGLIGLTILLAVLFLFQAGVEGAMAWRHRPHGGWGWMMFSAVASGVLGLLIVLGLPGTALWAIGLLVGVNFLTSGFAFLGLSRVPERV